MMARSIVRRRMKKNFITLFSSFVCLFLGTPVFANECFDLYRKSLEREIYTLHENKYVYHWFVHRPENKDEKTAFEKKDLCQAELGEDVLTLSSNDTQDLTQWFRNKLVGEQGLEPHLRPFVNKEAKAQAPHLD